MLTLNQFALTGILADALTEYANRDGSHNFLFRLKVSDPNNRPNPHNPKQRLLSYYPVRLHLDADATAAQLAYYRQLAKDETVTVNGSLEIYRRPTDDGPKTEIKLRAEQLTRINEN